MAPKPVPRSAINGYLFVCACVAAPFLNTRLCQLVSAILIVRFLMFAIQAAVTSDARRTFALGFLISALAYLSSVWLADEFQLRRGSTARLPTTALLTSLTEPLRSIYDAPLSSREAQLRHTARENGAAFLILGQLLFTFIFGTCGGHYANRLTKNAIDTAVDERRP